MPRASAAPADEAGRDQLVANYVFRIAENIDWPQSPSRKAMRLVVFSGDARRLTAELKGFANDYRIHGLPVEILECDTAEALPECDAVFVPRAKVNAVRDLTMRLEGRPVLVISEDYENQRLMMVNILGKDRKKLQFEINKANVVNQGLKPGAKLLLLGGTELDVAKLYKEGQENLVALETRLGRMDAEMAQRQAKAEAEMTRLNRQVADSRELQAKLAAQSEETQKKLKVREDAYARLKEQTDDAEKKLVEAREQARLSQERAAEIEALSQQTRAQLASLESDRDRLRAEMETQTKSYAEQTRLLADLDGRVAKQAADLFAKEAQLASSQAEIKKIRDGIQDNTETLRRQDEQIRAQTETLATQRIDLTRKNRFLMLLGISVAAGIVGILFIVRANRSLAQQRRLVSEQNEKLHQAQDSLVAARQAAEAANEAKSTFLASMSHEIRTPLNGVLGMAELIGSTNLTQEQRSWLGTLQLSGRMLLDIINDILDLSKIEAGKMTLEIAPFALAPQMDSVLRPLSLKAQEKGLALRLSIAPDVPAALLGDALRVRQILTNLVNNAIKFTPSGSVAVEVNAEPAEAPDALPLRIHIVVRDTGIGLSPEGMAKLFQPFVQAEASTTRRFGGTGLGLSISLRLVQLMGGRIWAESEPDKGSAFHVVLDLPVAAVMPEENAAFDAPLPPFSTACRVLLVEDNAINQQVASGILTRRGHAVTVAGNGAEALACVEQASFDIILMDIGMPVMNGMDAARRLRAREKERGLPRQRIVALSAGSSSGCNPATCREAGMDDYLAKPVPANQLCAVVENLDPARLAPATATSATAKPEAPAAARRVLLAEDNLINQKVACALLLRRGHAAVVANNGQEALDALAREPFDLVLMDMQMPVMDGLEATRLLRARERELGLPHQRVVAMTAGAMASDRDACLAAGMDGYMAKPFKAEDLYAVVEKEAGRESPVPPSSKLPA